MAIHFHEGLPGAGKSYEACVFHVLPAIKNGRQVVTNIRGINWEKFAELAGESVDYVRMLLLYIEPAEQDGAEGEIERVKNEFADRTPDNAMIVWDEIQDYYPAGQAKLPHNQQKFWTEHRHRGLEIVIMGQDRDDVHKIIRSRIEDIVYFLKLKAVGHPDKYKWEHFEKQGKSKFVKIGSGVRSYDAKYFGLYASHRREGVKAGVYTTSRSNIFKNTRGLTLGVPLAFALAGWGIWHLVQFFTPKQAGHSTAVTVQRPPAGESYTSPGFVNPDPPSSPAQAKPVAQGKVEPPPAIDYFDNLTRDYSVRASAILDSEKPGYELMGFVELLDATYHLKEQFTVAEIRALGWTVTRTGYGLLLEKSGVAHVARTWPLDLYGRVDQRTAESLDRSVSTRSGDDGAVKTEAKRAQIPVTVIGSSGG